MGEAERKASGVSDERTRERVRMEVEDAVLRALEAGFTPDEIREEVNYAIESAEE